MDRDAEGQRHSDEDNQNLISLRQADDLRPADDGVSDDKTAREPDGQIQVPPEHRGKNDGRGVNRNSPGDSALHQKQKRAEQARLLVETLAEIFVGGENFQPLIDRNENRADDNERERLPKIVLDETDAAFVGLARHGKKRDRARLRGHDGKPDGSPADAVVAFEVVAKIWMAVGAPKSVKRDREDRREEDDVIEPVHENRRVNA